jgi:hypothetical protein
MADTYILNSSLESQQSEPNKFASEYWVRVQDSNRGTYPGNEVSFDLQALSTYGDWLDMKNSYIELPYNIQLSCDVSGALPVEASSYAVGLKAAGFPGLIDSVAITLDEQTLVNYQTNGMESVPIFHKFISSASFEDREFYGDLCAMYPDNPNAVTYSESVNGTTGIACNTLKATDSVFDPTKSIISGQNFNSGLKRRCDRTSFVSTISGNVPQFDFVDSTGAAPAALVNTRKSFFRSPNPRSYIWHMNAVIPLKFVSEFFEKVGLQRLANYRLNLHVHNHNSSITLSSAGVASAVSNSNTGFGMCPYIFTGSSLTNCRGGFQQAGSATVVTIAAGLGGTNSLDSPFGNQSWFNAHMVKLGIHIESEYLAANLTKRIDYAISQLQTYRGLATGATLTDHQITSSVTRLRGVLIACYLASSINMSAGATNTSFSSGNTGGAIAPCLSPFAAEPYVTIRTTPLTNLQLKVSGEEIYQKSGGGVSHAISQYLREVKQYGSVYGGQCAGNGISSGLINPIGFESGLGFQYIDCTKMENPALNLQSRNISISCTNNSKNMLDIYFWIISERSVSLNCGNSKVEML